MSEFCFIKWRKRIQSKILAVLLVVALVGCSKEEISSDKEQQDQTNIPIGVTPYVQNSVFKANSLVNAAADLQNYSISLLGAVTLNNTLSVVFNNNALSYSAGVWSYGAVKYWIKGAYYNFAAFSPYASESTVGTSGAISNGTVTYTQNDNNPAIAIQNYITGRVYNGSNLVFDARSEDLLYSRVVRDNTLKDDYSSVPLQMNHILSCLHFNVRNTTNSDITAIDNISLGGLEYKCNLNIELSGETVTNVPLVVTEGVEEDSAIYFTANDISTESGEPAYLPKGMSETSYKPLYDCEYLTVLPQTVYGENILLKFTVHYGVSDTEGASYSVNLGALESVTKWVAGKKYTYNLTISSSDIIFQVVEVPWIEHEVEL